MRLPETLNAGSSEKHRTAHPHMTLKSKIVFLALGIVASGAMVSAWIGSNHHSIDSHGGHTVQTSIHRPVGKPALPSNSRLRLPASTTQAKQATDWGTRFRTTNDYFDFVSKAAPDALAGDGRAAVYIGLALIKCLGVVREYQRSADPEADFNAKLAAQPPEPQWILEIQREEFHSCIGFAKSDAFSSLPERPEGYAIASFWLTQAYNDHDPAALAIHAGNVLGTGLSTGITPESLNAAQSDIDEALSSADPPALFQLSRIFGLGGGAYGIRIVDGISLGIVACDLGYDCSAGNPEMETFLNCTRSGDCPPGSTYQDALKNLDGEATYAEAYSRAQELEYAFANGDSTFIHSFLRLQRNPAN